MPTRTQLSNDERDDRVDRNADAIRATARRIADALGSAADVALDVRSIDVDADPDGRTVGGVVTFDAIGRDVDPVAAFVRRVDGRTFRPQHDPDATARVDLVAAYAGRVRFTIAIRRDDVDDGGAR